MNWLVSFNKEVRRTLFLKTTLIISPTSALMTGPMMPRCSSLGVLSFFFVNEESVYSTKMALVYFPPILFEVLSKNTADELKLINTCYHNWDCRYIHAGWLRVDKNRQFRNNYLKTIFRDFIFWLRIRNYFPKTLKRDMHRDMHLKR